MSKEDNVNKIKSYIEDILGAKSSLRKKLPTKKSREKELFCEILNNLQFVNARTLGMKHDYKVNMMEYDDPFYIAIENLFQLNYELIVPTFFVLTSLLLISKFPTYSFKKIVIPRRTTIFLLFGIVLFFGLLLIYTFNVIAISTVVYVFLLPISFFHFQKIKKQHENDKIQEDDDLEDEL